jgi:hypothetical protein
LCEIETTTKANREAHLAVEHEDELVSMMARLAPSRERRGLLKHELRTGLDGLFCPDEAAGMAIFFGSPLRCGLPACTEPSSAGWKPTPYNPTPNPGLPKNLATPEAAAIRKEYGL